MSRQQGLDEANKYFNILAYDVTSLRKNKHLLSLELKLYGQTLMSVQMHLASGKMHLAHSSTKISQVLLHVESTCEIKIVLRTKIEPLTKQEHRWRKSKTHP